MGDPHCKVAIHGSNEAYPNAKRKVPVALETNTPSSRKLSQHWWSLLRDTANNVNQIVKSGIATSRL